MYAELKRRMCVVCKREFSAYHKSKQKCQICSKQIWAENKAKNRHLKRKDDPLKHKRIDFVSDLKKNYGLSVEKFEIMYSNQKGCCALCGRHESDFKRGLHVDHDHKSGQVRGLLCTKCNPGLGYFDDSTEKLEMAITYLNKFKK